MNAKARKKEKRRAERAALRATTAAEDAAQDAVTSTAKGPSETPPSCTCATTFLKDTFAYTPEEDQRILTELLPVAFAAAVKTRLEARGQPPPDDNEVNMLQNLMEDYILDAMEQGLEARRQLKESDRRELRFVWGWGINEHNDHTKKADQETSTQDPETTKREAQLQSVQPRQQPIEGSVRANTDQANATTTEEKGLWDVAAEKAQLEGGSTTKIYKAMKKKLKAKERKQAVKAA